MFELDKKTLNKFTLFQAIRLVIAGWLFDDGDIRRVPELLEEIASYYRQEINKQMENNDKK